MSSDISTLSLSFLFWCFYLFLVHFPAFSVIFDLLSKSCAGGIFSFESCHSLRMRLLKSFELSHHLTTSQNYSIQQKHAKATSAFKTTQHLALQPSSNAWLWTSFFLTYCPGKVALWQHVQQFTQFVYSCCTSQLKVQGVAVNLSFSICFIDFSSVIHANSTFYSSAAPVHGFFSRSKFLEFGPQKLSFDLHVPDSQTFGM